MYVSPRVKIIGAGARGSLQRCSKQGAVHGLGVRCLLHTEPEERRPVLWSELKADASIDH